MIVYNEPRFLSAIKPAGTKSFRLSATKLFGIYGNNAQNINYNSLDIIISDPGCSFVQVDQDGAEARVVAYDAPSGKLRALFDLGVKSHFYVCLLLFAKHWKNKVSGIDYMRLAPPELIARPEWLALCKEMKGHPTHYDTSKTSCHMANYGSAAYKFQTTILKLSRGKIVLTYEEAKSYLEFYHALFPEIRVWHQMLEAEVRQNRMLRNFFGHPRRFEELFNSTYMREIYSWIPQSTVACITHEATIDMQNYIRDDNKRWHVMNNKHDSYLLQCPDEDVEQCKKMGVKFMARELYNRRGEKFQMRAEATVGKNWKL